MFKKNVENKKAIVIHSFLFGFFIYVNYISYPYKGIVDHLINALFSYSIVLLTLKLGYLASKKVYIIISIILSLYFAFIIYYCIAYGQFIDLGSFASIVETTYSEATDFLKQLDRIGLLYSLLSLLFMLYVFICGKNIIRIQCPGVLLLLIIFSVAFMCKVTTAYDRNYNKKQLITAALSKHFLFDSALIAKDFMIHLREMNHKIEPTWTGVKYNEENIDLYLIVVGESVVRQHMQIYGYSRNTTPELENFPGITVVSDAISPAAQTRHSVPRLLAMNNITGVDYNKNIIDLVNMAGLESYWISNQGFIGRHDTPVSKIAARANTVIYMNKGEFYKSGFDSMLWEPLKSAIDSTNEKKVIFLHLLGSHPEFCERVWSEYFIGDENYRSEINCYDDSVRNTSIFLSKILKYLNNYNAKVVFTADHGFTQTNTTPYLVYGVGKYFSKSALEVPLIFWDNRKNEKKLIDKTYYMRNFISTLAEFLNIEANEINYQYSILNSNYYIDDSDNYVIRSDGEIHRFNPD